jgi:hypothetical protein
MKQGGAEVARLAHNQKVAGSNPAPATNSPLFVSPERANGAGNDAPRFSAPTFNEALH